MHCNKCGSKLNRVALYDAYACKSCNEWRDTKCADSSCELCAERPDKPFNSISYESFMNELEILAETNGLDIHRDKYHYHTYFVRGWEPQGVIDDIKEMVSMSDS